MQAIGKPVSLQAGMVKQGPVIWDGETAVDLLMEDIRLAPIAGYPERILHPVIGSKLPESNKVTKFMRSRMWAHRPSELAVGISIDLVKPWGPLLHVSISYYRQDPDWYEIKALRDIVGLPTVDFMMMLPRHEDYVNVHEHCFQFMQTPEPWRIM